jgi:hypothetical protein
LFHFPQDEEDVTVSPFAAAVIVVERRCSQIINPDRVIVIQQL